MGKEVRLGESRRESRDEPHNREMWKSRRRVTPVAMAPELSFLEV